MKMMILLTSFTNTNTYKRHYMVNHFYRLANMVKEQKSNSNYIQWNESGTRRNQSRIQCLYCFRHIDFIIHTKVKKYQQLLQIHFTPQYFGK